MTYCVGETPAWEVHSHLMGGRYGLLPINTRKLGVIKVTNDPSALICVVADLQSKQLWVFDEHYEQGMFNDRIANVIEYKGYKKEIITADGADKKSIAELKRLGIRRIRPAKKGNDSILQGIGFVSQFKVWVHPDCKNTIMELENYSWTKNKQTNEYMNKPIDKYNHLMDALRYALEEVMRQGKVKTISKASLGL